MKRIHYTFLGLLCLSTLFLFQACKKDKLDFNRDNRNLTVNRANSTARIINLGEYNQVVANGDSLTNFQIIPTTQPQLFRGTSYFPSNGLLGKSWYIPQDLFNAQGSVKLDLMTRAYQSASIPDLTLNAENDYKNPTDYYVLPKFAMDGQPDVVPITRGVSLPSKPDHFKIRIINLTGDIKTKGNNANGSLENLVGNVSLAYADGTLVNTQTSNVSSAQKASEYIELPYGTYQFKVLTQDGRQMPALGSEQAEFTIIDPATSTIPKDFSNSTGLTYAPIQTYQPGGIYTILVAPQRFKYLINELSETSDTFQNAFQLINDNSAAVNNTYFRIQAANALDNQKVSFRLGGKTFAADLSFGAAADYSNFIQGKHRIEALDASGKVIASTEEILRPSQNYTTWLYPDQSGVVKLLLVANDLSGATYTGGMQDDATFARNQFRYFFFKRFLNLSVGNPYITFTLNNGQSSSSGNDNTNAGVNLQPGQPLYERPYVSSVYNSGAFEVMAYRSKLNVIPGIWADDVAVLKNEDFIANKTLYQQAGRRLPVQEPGIYTISLIGHSGAGSTPANKAKMIIIKHNK